MVDEAARRGLGEQVRRRREKLGLSIPAAAKRAEIDRETWRHLEAGTRELRSYLHVKVEKTLGWQAGSIDAVRSGGDPRELPAGLAENQPPRYSHPELGEITHPQDVQLWEATTFDEDTRVGYIFQARAKRMREGPPSQRAAG